jgi:ribokinase
MDLAFGVETLPGPGQTVLASAMRTSPGGKGGNQSVAAARAGADVALVAAVGDDAHGVALREHLRRNGVGLNGVTVLPVPSGTAAIVVSSDAENMIVVAPGANAHLTLDSRRVRDIVADCEVLVLQLEIPADTALAAARHARRAGATVVLNASPPGRTDLAALAEVTDVVIVNESEAAHWRWPVAHLVTTLGSRGASCTGPDGLLEVSAPEVEAVDTTGAGDVFAGVLAAEWTSAGSREVALRRACAAGALATLVPGAGNCAPSREAIDDVLAD